MCRKELFKYRSCNDDSLKSLVNNTIWVSQTKDFNDPFEGMLVLHNDASDDDINRCLIDNLREERTVEEIRDNSYNIIYNHLKEYVNEPYVFCLSESQKN